MVNWYCDTELLNFIIKTRDDYHNAAKALRKKINNPNSNKILIVNYNVSQNELLYNFTSVKSMNVPKNIYFFFLRYIFLFYIVFAKFHRL